MSSMTRHQAIHVRLNYQDYCCYRCGRRFWKQWRKNNDKPQNFVVQTYPDGAICPILCRACFLT